MTIEDQVYEVYDVLEKLDSKYTLKNKDIAFECIQKAISLKNKELEFDARHEYLSQLVFMNFHDQAIALYPWFLNYKKNNEIDYYRYHSLVWSFKWVVGRIGSYGKISRQQIDTLFDQFEQEVLEFGAGKKIISYFKLTLHTYMGNLEEAEVHLKAYKRSRAVSSIDDCYACQINNVVDFSLQKRDYKKVIRDSKDLVYKKYTCDSVPKTTYPKICMAYMMLGNSLKAEEFYQLSVKELRLTQPQIPNVGYLLYYLAKNKMYVQAKKLLDKQLKYSFETNADLYKLRFCIGCYFLFKNAAADAIEFFKLNVDESFALEATKKGYRVAELRDWYKTQVEEYIKLLDTRNGNSFYQEYFDYLENEL